MDTPEERIREIAKSEGVTDYMARQIARETMLKIEAASRPEIEPELLIREVGDHIEVELPSASESKAREIAEQHTGKYLQLVEVQTSNSRVVHRFEPRPESDDDNKDIEENFKDLPPDEREEVLQALIDSHGGA